jgi:hypothetical protein
MARKRRKLETAPLERQPPDDLRLPSLVADKRLEGHALRYTLVLPLLSEFGEEVFSFEDHLGPLLRLLSRRFGGFTRTAHIPQPPLLGGWYPEGAPAPVLDQNLEIRVYARQIPDAADHFFQRLKSLLLKAVVYQPQEEILIERVPVWLVRRE